MANEIPIGKVTTKKELEDYLHNKRVPLMLSLFFTKIPKSSLLENLKKSTLKINDDEVDFSPIAKSLEDNEQYKKIINHMVNLAIKNAITDYYEAIQKYCKKSEQSKLFKKQSWYNYSYLIRNGLSHDYEWDFTLTNEKIFPVTYKQIIITHDLHGTLLQENQMPLSVIWVLLQDMENFVKSNLN